MRLQVDGLVMFWTTQQGYSRLNQLKSGLTLTQYLTMHVSILDHIRHLNFDLLRSLKVKCDSVSGLPIYGFILMFNSNIWPDSAPLQDI